MKLALSLFGAAGFIFLLVDMIWLGVVARGLYVSEIGMLLKNTPNWGAAIAFYLIFLGGLTFFVLLPGYADGSLMRVALTGAAFGLVAYATYDLTNLATLQGFTVKIAVIDMLWGTALTALASTGAVLVVRRLMS